MKQNKIIFIILAVFALLAGLTYYFMMTKIIVDGPWEVITVQEQAAIQQIQVNVLQRTMGRAEFVNGLAVVFFVVFSVLLSRELNPHLKASVWKRYPGNVKTLIGILAGMVAAMVVTQAVSTAPSSGVDIFGGIFFGSMFWLIMGETGWAGDLTSWKANSLSWKVAGYGAASAAASILIMALVYRFFIANIGRVLALDVAGSSIAWSSAIAALLLFCAFVTIVIFARACAPRFLEADQRRRAFKESGLVMLGCWERRRAAGFFLHSHRTRGPR